ncbi:MAG: M48 family metallopeptidase [Verrucomicrobiota bacterium]
MNNAPPKITATTSGRMASIFAGTIQPTELSGTYRLGLVIVAIVMVLLPAVYVGLIAATGTLVGWHAVNHIQWMSNRGGWLVYLTPIVVGVVMVLFMIKPLFARPPKRPDSYSVKREEEPGLFDFIDQICRQVRAPLPSRVDLDCQVNASASFRRGLWSLFGNDLVLTIGLPLASGMSQRELGGVLAHEFGHFAQGGGMRLTYVIRSVSFWFARVVYERDAWDEKLADYSRNTDIRLGLILYTARGCVWLTRKVLWVLMMLGNVISSFMLRQMEFDADSYEVKVAGTEAFIATARKLQLLGVGSQLGMQHLRQSWQSKRLPDNFPAFALQKSREVSGDILAKIEESQAVSKTGMLDTHPCDAARIAQAKAMNQPGLIQTEAPATSLFTEYSRVAQGVTQHFYRQMLEEDFKPEALVSTDEMLRETSQVQQGYEAADRYLMGLFSVLRPLTLQEHEVMPLPNPDLARQAFTQCRQQAEAQRAEAKAAMEAYAEAYGKVRVATLYQHAQQAGLTIKDTEFKLPGKTLAETIQLQLNACKDEQPVAQRLKPLEATVHRRLVAALQWLATPGVAEKAGLPGGVLEAQQLVRVLAVLGPLMPRVLELERLGYTLKQLLDACQKNNGTGQVTHVLDGLAAKARAHLTELEQALGTVKYPFSHAQGELSLAEFARADGQHEHQWIMALMQCGAVSEKLPGLYGRVLGRLAVLAEKAEG